MPTFRSLSLIFVSIFIYENKYWEKRCEMPFWSYLKGSQHKLISKQKILPHKEREENKAKKSAAFQLKIFFARQW